MTTTTATPAAVADYDAGRQDGFHQAHDGLRLMRPGYHSTRCSCSACATVAAILANYRAR